MQDDEQWAFVRTASVGFVTGLLATLISSELGASLPMAYLIGVLLAGAMTLTLQ